MILKFNRILSLLMFTLSASSNENRRLELGNESSANRVVKTIASKALKSTIATDDVTLSLEGGINNHHRNARLSIKANATREDANSKFMVQLKLLSLGKPSVDHTKGIRIENLHLSVNAPHERVKEELEKAIADQANNAGVNEKDITQLLNEYYDYVYEESLMRTLLSRIDITAQITRGNNLFTFTLTESLCLGGPMKDLSRGGKSAPLLEDQFFKPGQHLLLGIDTLHNSTNGKQINFGAMFIYKLANALHSTFCRTLNGMDILLYGRLLVKNNTTLGAAIVGGPRYEDPFANSKLSPRGTIILYAHMKRLSNLLVELSMDKDYTLGAGIGIDVYRNKKSAVEESHQTYLNINISYNNNFVDEDTKKRKFSVSVTYAFKVSNVLIKIKGKTPDMYKEHCWNPLSSDYYNITEDSYNIPKITLSVKVTTPKLNNNVKTDNESLPVYF